jgi:hypothetical protein
MSKDTTITAQSGETQGKPRVAKPSSSKSAVSKPRTSKPKSVKAKSVKAKKPAGMNPVSTKPAAPAKAGAQTNASVSGLSLGRSLQVTMPVAVAVNTKLVDMAHSNVSAGLELARDLAGAKTPIEAMRLGVAYWFNHMGAVQAQARELQSLSAAWVKTASQQIRTF